MIIQIIGLPGSGKTVLAEVLVSKINAIHLNADKVREYVNYDLGFSHADRIKQSKRLGGIARILSEQGYDVVVDFVCPTKETRTAFGIPDILIWVDRIKSSRYEDTNHMWEEPKFADIIIANGMTVEEEVNFIIGQFK